MRHVYAVLPVCLLILAIAFTPGASDERARATSDREPPVAKKVPHVRELHGDRFVDDYFWLREKSNPEVTKHLEAENAFTDAVMKPLEGLQETLYDEMLGRIKETDLSVPYRDGNHWYYTRTEQGKQYQILCRKRGSLDAPEEIYLDVNELAKGEKFMALGAVAVSDDGNLVAYSTDNTGFREYRLHVKDLRIGKVVESPVDKVVAVAWAADNETLFYTTPDAAKRSYRLYRHTLGQTDDALLYEEADERFRVDVSRSRSKDYLFLDVDSHTASEVRYLRADQPTAAWQLVAARENDHEYDVDHRGDLFYIRTNQGGRNFGLMTAPTANPDRGNWTELIPHRADVMLQRAILFRDHLVLSERENGLPGIRVQRFGTAAWQAVQFPEPVYTSFPTPGPEFDTTALRYRYESFTTPSSVFEYDMSTRQTKLLKEDEVLGGYDRTKYTSERIHATAADGTKVPVSLVYLKSLKRDGTAPLFLTAYGSYGAPSNVGFSSNRFSLIDRGVVYALAHIRGGGDLGKPWHDAGRMMNKKNTFTDFIAVAEHLLAERYGAKDRLVIEGGSAGGLLMGAVTNMRPDLFTAVVAHVPFVDVINTMSDASLPLTVTEFEEWGNPAKKDEYEYIKSYCPYTNLEPAAYPAMLVKTSLDDSQVMYWEPAKYVARMRALKTDDNPLILKTNTAAGHGGASGRYDRLREIAFDYAFMLWQMKVPGVLDP
ncbi:MAG: prolyl oligopeptidase family serine peptidase [Luteitalea sp.]|nr:prolyl oligopeptidase family serine peptidase [Luteitalea sp.]